METDRDVNPATPVYWQPLTNGWRRINETIYKLNVTVYAVVSEDGWHVNCWRRTTTGHELICRLGPDLDTVVAFLEVESSNGAT